MFCMDVPDKKNNNWTSILTVFIPNKTAQPITKTTNKQDEYFLTSKKTDGQRDGCTDCCRNTKAICVRQKCDSRSGMREHGCRDPAWQLFQLSASAGQMWDGQAWGTWPLHTLSASPPIHTPNSSKLLQCYHSCKYMHLVQCLLKDTCPELNQWCKMPDTTTNPVKQQQYKPEQTSGGGAGWVSWRPTTRRSTLAFKSRREMLLQMGKDLGLASPDVL